MQTSHNGAHDANLSTLEPQVCFVYLHTCFDTILLQCLRDAPQRLMYLTIIYDRSHAYKWASAHCLVRRFDLLLQLPQDLCASYTIVVIHIILIHDVLYINIAS